MQRTARLSLRPWARDDLDAFHAIWGDPAVIFWGALDRDGCAALLARMVEPSGPGLRWWAMSEHESGNVVGNIVLQPAAFANGQVEIGWHVARCAQRRGYATEAARALLQQALHAHPRVVAAILPDNTPSQRVAQKVGMERRGTVLHAQLLHQFWVCER